MPTGPASMPLTANDLLSPKGRVEPSFFPNDDLPALTARLEGYLAEGVAKVPAEVEDPDPAVEAWAYHRVFDAMASRLNSTPASVALVDQGSRTYQAHQLKNLYNQSRDWLNRFHSLVQTEVVEAQEGQTQAVQTQVRWW